MEATPARLRVAFVPGVTPDKWAAVWGERHRRIRLNLVPTEESRQRTVLDDGGADLCLARLPEDPASLLREDLHCVVLYDELPVVVASREHFVAAADEVPLTDLDQELLLLPHSSGWRPADAGRAEPGMTVQQAMATAAAGTGILVVPMSIARLHHRKDVVWRPVTDLPATTVGLIWHKDEDSPLHQDFVGVVRGRRAGSSRGLRS